MIRFLLLLFITDLYAAASIVFVHIGPQLPSYLPIALKQARLFNPHSDLYLIANERALANLSKEIKESRPLCISCESLPKGPFHKKFAKKSKLDKTFRKGFWTFTTERFFYLAELIEKRKLTDVFHLENDVMLYADLEELLPIFKEHYSNKIGATFDNDERCIPGFLYISNYAPIERLIDFIAQKAQSGGSDMEFLAQFKDQGGWIDNLPVLMPQYANDHELISSFGCRGTRPDHFHRHFDQFSSIFDAAALGQFLGGIDPDNGRSIPGFINERCIFNPSHFAFEWRKDEQGRRVPFAIYGKLVSKINNLHIHSKDLKKFYSGK